MLFVVVFSFLWFNRVNSAGGLSDIDNYMYMTVVVLGVLLFFFDSGVQKYFGRRANYQQLTSALNRRILTLQAQYQQYIALDTDLAKQERSRILKEIRHLEEEVHKYS